MEVVYTFGDPQEVIRGRSQPQNGLWHPWYILYKILYILYKILYILHKIWYILKKIWYIQALNYKDRYLITHDLFFPLGISGKWLEVDPYSEMDFWTTGTSLRKFGTSNL